MTVRSRTVTLIATSLLVIALGTGSAVAGSVQAAQGRAWLVQQGGGCAAPTDPTSSTTYGLVSIGRLDSTPTVTVQILRGVPSERYTVNLSCIGDIGEVHTDARGRGATHLSISDERLAQFRTLGLPFAIDVHLYCAGGDCTARFSESARTATLTVGP